MAFDIVGRYNALNQSLANRQRRREMRYGMLERGFEAIGNRQEAERQRAAEVGLEGMRQTGATERQGMSGATQEKIPGMAFGREVDLHGGIEPWKAFQLELARSGRGNQSSIEAAEQWDKIFASVSNTYGLDSYSWDDQTAQYVWDWDKVEKDNFRKQFTAAVDSYGFSKDTRAALMSRLDTVLERVGLDRSVVQPGKEPPKERGDGGAAFREGLSRFGLPGFREINEGLLTQLSQIDIGELSPGLQTKFVDLQDKIRRKVARDADVQSFLSEVAEYLAEQEATLRARQSAGQARQESLGSFYERPENQPQAVPPVQIPRRASRFGTR
jgi:hypothetical protein